MSEHSNGESKAKKKHALIVGVNTSSHSSFTLAPLHYAENDAQGLNWPLSRDECGFVVSTLIGEDASANKVKDALIDLVDNKSKADLLLFYFIGHGYPVQTAEGNHEVFLVTSDFDPDRPQRHPDMYISLNYIQKKLFEVNKDTSAIIIIDCCFAGNIFENHPDQQFLEAFHRMVDRIKGTKNPVGPSRCKAIIASTQANASAYEGNGHVRMTGLILDALSGNGKTAVDNEGNVTVGGLCVYVLRQATQWGEEQQPVTDWSGRDFTLGRAPIKRDSFTPPGVVQPFFDETISEKNFADLNIERVKTFLQGERSRLQDDYRAGLDEREQMQKFGWLQEDHPSYGALLCFGNSPTQPITGAYTRCTCWDDEKGLVKPIADKRCRGNLLQQFAQACDFLKEHLTSSNAISGESSKEPEIPFHALEEALANALIHREYVTEPDRFPRAKEVAVEILSNRIKISSPGGPPAHVSLDALQNAQEKHPGSHPRNPQIMRIFYLAGLAEHVGTGIERMQHYIQQAGLQQAQFDFNPVAQMLTVTLFRPAQPRPIPDNGQLPEIESQIGSIVPVPVKPPLDPWRRFFWFLLPMMLIVGISIGSVGQMVIAHGFTPPPMLTPTLPPPSMIIEIAADFPTNSSSGQALLHGVQMAIDSSNNNRLLSDYKVTLVPFSDDTGNNNGPNPQKEASNIQKAIADNLVAGIIGPGDSVVAEAELPITNRAPIAQISPTTTYPCLTKSSTDDPDCSGNQNIQPQVRPTDQLTFFRLATTDDQQGKATADYLFTKKHYHKVLLLNDESDAYNLSLTLSFQNEWTQLGGEVVPLNLPGPANSVEKYQETLQERASIQPDLIYFVGNNPNSVNVLHALFNIPALKSVPFAGGPSIMDDDFLQAAKQWHSSAPVYASLPIQDPVAAGTDAGVDFRLDYIANGYSNYSPFAPSAYDSTMILIKAIQSALQTGVTTPRGTQDHDGAVQFRKAIVQALAHVSYTGATGIHSFDANGDTTNHTVSFYQLDFSAGQADWTWVSGG